MGMISDKNICTATRQSTGAISQKNDVKPEALNTKSETMLEFSKSQCLKQAP
jgi:hypothetical protein